MKTLDDEIKRLKLEPRGKRTPEEWAATAKDNGNAAVRAGFRYAIRHIHDQPALKYALEVAASRLRGEEVT